MRLPTVRIAVRGMTVAAFVTCFLALPAASEASHGKRGPADAATLALIIALALASAAVGKRTLNRVSAVFLGGVGGAIGAGMWHNLTGAALGLLAGAVIVVLPWFRKPPKACEPETRVAVLPRATATPAPPQKSASPGL